MDPDPTSESPRSRARSVFTVARKLAVIAWLTLVALVFSWIAGLDEVLLRAVPTMDELRDMTLPGAIAGVVGVSLILVFIVPAVVLERIGIGPPFIVAPLPSDLDPIPYLSVWGTLLVYGVPTVLLLGAILWRRPGQPDSATHSVAT